LILSSIQVGPREPQSLRNFTAIDFASVPGELFANFQTSLYSDPVDAIAKALGME
jgi:predicted ATP-dependent Lon-type protease